MISRTIDIEYSSIVCREAFNLTTPAKTERVNRYGGFSIRRPRLAFIDGEWDPWRAVGVHAFGAPARRSSTNQPFLLIDGGVHHWDENGLLPNETTPDLPPPPIVDVKKQMVEFVRDWVKEWEAERLDIGNCPTG